MKTGTILLLQFILLFSFSAFSQNYEEGQLYLYVADSTGIPTFIHNGDDTLVEMQNPNLESLFNTYGVYSFDRSFPIIDSLNCINDFGLDSVYTLKCTGNDSLLLLEIDSLNLSIYYYVERIPKIEPLFTPNDYHLLDPQFNGEHDYALDLINAEEAWDITTGDPNVKLGYVDFGLDPFHEDFDDQIEYIHNGLYQGTPDGNSHGTFVGGLLAAKTDNGIGKSAIGFNSKIYFVLIGDGDDAVELMLHLLYQGVKVFNCSWYYTGGYTVTHNNIIQLINQEGGVIIAGAGNEGEKNLVYPACYENVLCVSSVGTDYLFEFDNPTHGIQYHNYHYNVDVCAPGHLVRSLDVNNGYNESSGTSFASPITAGTAGLIKAVYPNASPKHIMDLFCWGAKYIDGINPIKYSNRMGYGCVDAYRSVHGASLMPIVPHNFTITNGENIVWNTTKWIDNEVRVLNGGKLTIESLVFFNEDAKVVVERGGILEIDGGYLTSYGNFLWHGIEVWGNKHESQFVPNEVGEVRFKNRASISYAEIGIRTTRTYETDHSSDEYNGGVIIAQNTIFTNNLRAVEFTPYENKGIINDDIVNNRSYFSNCFFEYEHDLSELGEFTCFVKLSGVRGIRFLGCDFIFNAFEIYSNPLHYILSKKNGIGIYSEDSDFSVDVHISEIHGQILKPTKFSKLYYGIYAEGASFTKTATINKCVFDEIFRSIYLSGLSNPVITSDTIDVGMSVWGTSEDTSYAIYLDHCTGFKVEENDIGFITDDPGIGYLQFTRTAGIIVNNAGYDYNEIYNNTIYDLRVGIVAQNINRGLNNSYLSGLKIFCNNMYQNRWDIAVTYNELVFPIGISKYQGYYWGPDDFYSSGNLFSKNFLNIDGDYNNDAMFVQYYHHDPFSKPRVLPEDYTENTVLRNDNFNQYNTISSCPSKLLLTTDGTDSLQMTIAQSKNTSDSIHNILESYVDDGNTELMVIDVSTSFPDEAWDVYNDLMDNSPYLSDTVMEEMILKENVLAEAMVRDIMVANPQSAKSGEVMTSLDDRFTPLPDYMISDIEQGKTVTSAKETLESMISHHSHMSAIAKNELIRFYIRDTVQPGPNDSLIALLENEESNSAKYKLAMIYCEKGDITSMNTCLNSIIDPGGEHQHYVDFFGLMESLHTASKTVFQVDSAQKVLLNSIMQNSNGQPKIWSRNILSWRGEVDYNEVVVFPEPSLKLSPIVNDDKLMITENELSIYPNPASKYVVATWKVAGSNRLQLDFIDMKGRIMQTESLDNNIDQKVININSLSSGAYILRLRSDTKVIDTQKLSIR